MTITEKIAPIHPGEVLMEDFINGFGITQHKLALAIGVPPRRINEIVHGKRGMAADTAIRLARSRSFVRYSPTKLPLRSTVRRSAMA